MANIDNCEKYVIEKLISVFSKSLNCNGNNDGEVLVVEKVLQVLLSQNESLFNTGDESKGFMRSITDETEFGLHELNSTNSVVTYGGDEATGLSVGVETTNDQGEPTLSGINRLHKLEIIKVFVLIFVISIILLTTCRMVFQLFIRFRPEKPPLG